MKRFAFSSLIVLPAAVLLVLIFWLSLSHPATSQASEPLENSVFTATLQTDPKMLISPVDPLTVQFSQPVKLTGEQPALLTIPYVAGAITWNEERTLLTFTPQKMLQPNTSYLVFLDSKLESSDGIRIAPPYHWEVRTISLPKIISHSPSMLDTKKKQQEIQVSFSRPMNEESVFQAFSIEPEIPFELKMIQPALLSITLKSPLMQDTRYRFSLAGTAMDTNNIPLGEDARFDYHTPPFNYEYKLSKNHSIQIDFNYLIDKDKTGIPAVISPAIPGEWSWLDNDTLVYNAQELLSFGVKYHVSFVAPIFDLQGNLHFQLPAFDLWREPPIGRVTPLANDWDRCGEISIRFLVEMDQAKTEAAFQLKPQVQGAFTWSGNQMRFIPAVPNLEGNYVAQLNTGATTADGKPILVEPYSWTFRCYLDWYSEPLTWGYGDKIQIVDAAGRRAIQFSKTSKEPERINFELFSLSKDAFKKLYLSDTWTDKLPNSPVKTWDITTTAGTYQEMFLPEDIRPGLYVLKMKGLNHEDLIMLVLTHFTLVVKEGAGEVVVWTTDINGKAVAGFKVEVFAERGEKISQGKTDDQGMFEGKIASIYNPTLVIATSPDGEYTISGLDYAWKSGGCWYRCGNEQDRHKIYTFTDRPIYKPGQTVYFKSIVRWDEDAQYRLVDEKTSILVNLRDSRNNLLQSQTLKTNSFGTINGQFILSDGAGLGLYTIEVNLDGKSYTQVFKVQDYRKPDIQVKLATNQERYVQKDTVDLKVNTQYFFGQAVANAKVTVKLYELYPDWDWWWDGDESTSNINEKFNWSYNAQVIKVGMTDPNGVFTATFKAKMGEYNSFAWWKNSLEKSLWAIEVTVDDGSNQETSASKIIQVYNSNIKISLDRGNYFKEAGKSFTLEAQAFTLDNLPVANQKLFLSLYGTSGRYWDFSRLVAKTEVTTDENGKVSIPWTIENPGYYEFRLRTMDDQNRELTFERTISVVAGIKTGWQEWMSDELKIYSEFDHYKPQQTARFMIESTFSGPALLTLERGKILRTIPIQLTKPLTEVKIPLTTTDSPNVYVTVSAWQGIDNSLETLLKQEDSEWYLESAPDSRLRSDAVEIQVDASFRGLQVEITPEQDSYAPRQEAKFTIRVSDSQGKPVNAELSLALVDEAIFSLSNELSGPIFDAFYQRRNLSVATFNSMEPRRYLIDRGGERGGGGGDGEGGESPRSDFPDTALWLPVERTGDDGTITITVSLPDSLTTWRLTAKAVTRSTRVGEGIAMIKTSKEVSLRPILPRSLTVEDQLNLTAWVHNFSPVTRTLTINMMADRLTINSSPTQTLTLAPEEARQIFWDVTAKSEGETIVLIEAIDPLGASDSIQLPLTIHPLASPFVDSQVGEFETSVTTTLVLPEDALSSSQYELFLHRTLAGNLFQGLEYLTGYPYGCVEQTMSRVLPNAVVARVMDRLGWSTTGLQKNLPKLIETGINKLYGMQHHDGGWGWWFDDLSNDYQTAWVVYGLSVTADAGYPVDPQVIAKGADWLVENLESMDIRTRAFALYSLAIAGHGEKEITKSLTAKFYDLDPFSQAALVISLEILEEKEIAQNLLDTLLDLAVVKGNQVFWINARYDGEYDRKTMASNLRSTALVLDALLKLRPKHEKIPGIVRYLMNQRHGYGWGNTNETSFTILALTNYILTENTTGKGSNVEITVNGIPIFNGTVNIMDTGLRVSVPISQLHTGVNDLKIISLDNQRIYYELISTIWLPTPSRKAAGEVQIFRHYYDPKTGTELQSFKAGQLVEVRLFINFPEDAAFIMVEDHLPGGLEALNENLNNTAFNPYLDDYGNDETRYRWKKYGYNQKQIFADRVTFFISQVTKTSYTFRYLTRANQSGTFYAMPAEVSAMYNPSIYGRSDSAILIISP